MLKLFEKCQNNQIRSLCERNLPSHQYQHHHHHLESWKFFVLYLKFCLVQDTCCQLLTFSIAVALILDSSSSFSPYLLTVFLVGSKRCLYQDESLIYVFFSRKALIWRVTSAQPFLQILLYQFIPTELIFLSITDKLV